MQVLDPGWCGCEAWVSSGAGYFLFSGCDIVKNATGVERRPLTMTRAFDRFTLPD